MKTSRKSETTETKRSRGVMRAIFCALVTFGMIFAGTAQAIYLDFAAYQGSESGNSADLMIGGQSVTVSSQPTRYDLRISRAGLGIRCTDTFEECSGNSDNQIDSEWLEQITITFNDGPVELNSVLLSRIYRNDIAIVSAGSESTEVRGSALGWWDWENAHVNLDMGGIVVSEITLTAFGQHSDYTVRAIDFNPRVVSSPIPEPHAALLFAVGMGVVASRRRS